MTPALRVSAPGLLTTIQDLGRFGYQHLGVPVSGALDTVSLRAANLLVGNPPEAAAIEAAYVGPTLVAQADDVRIAVVGASTNIEILPEDNATHGRAARPLQSLYLRRGEALRLGPLKGGMAAYIAVEGGFDIAPVLGSLSTCIRGGFGGWQGRALVAGDVLPLRRRASERDELQLAGFDLSPPQKVRAIPGPQADYFSDSEIAAFFRSTYIVGPSMNRMGMRLTGRPIQHARGFDIPSDAIAAGSIQVPGTGQPIVLLADRQTTGGYPKIATVISADIPALSRFPLGGEIAFEPVTVEVAESLRRQHIASVAALASKLVPVDGVSADVTSNLSTCNLISGFIDIAA
ncbi:MAG: biotin-dependent carboxyltransferase family protein [Xanthobacteraceae bacterium]